MMAITTVHHTDAKDHVSFASQTSHIQDDNKGLERQNCRRNDAQFFGKQTCCTVLSIMNHNGHFCATTVWLLLCLIVLGWKNREIRTSE